MFTRVSFSLVYIPTLALQLVASTYTLLLSACGYNSIWSIITMGVLLPMVQAMEQIILYTVCIINIS